MGQGDGADLAAMRREYEQVGLHEQDASPDPLVQFARWLADAVAAGLAEPNAMVLSTTGQDGPHARTVLLKGYGDAGFRFFTNLDSAKAHELAARPRASLLFPWHPLARQVRVEGAVSQLSRDEVAAYAASRPRESQLGAWASRQSRVVASRAELEDRYDELAARWPEGTEVPVPPFWGGYRVRPETVEFWAGRRGRLHDRLRYRRDGDSWRRERLAP
jgi:pyridoxamine 5'-phosphate oxidase